MAECQMFVKNGLQPAPNVPNPRNAGRKKSNPVWEFFTDLRSYGLAGVRCRFCHWVTNDRSPTTMKFHLKRKHDTGVGGLWAICEEKINAQAPANYAPRMKKSDDALLKALTQHRPLNVFNPFAPPVAEAKITKALTFAVGRAVRPQHPAGEKKLLFRLMMTEVEAPPRKGRKAIAWRLVGTYTSKEDLLAAKKTEKVSKRKSDELRIGTKVTYRCNSWKRTRCQYQMYALYGADGSIRLYEGGQHDHGKVRVPGAQPKLSLLEATTSEELQEFRKASPEQPVTTAAEREAANTLHALANAGMTSQDEFLANLIQQATSMAASTPAEINGGLNMEAFVSGDPNESTLSLSDTLFLNKLNEGCLPKEEDGSSSSVSGLVSNPSDFNLSDGTSISALLQIASDADLAFSFNSRRTAEYCFSSNQRAGRSVVFSDTGPEIRVAQKIGDEEICVETWRKSDWSQFCWAVRGTCLHFLKN